MLKDLEVAKAKGLIEGAIIKLRRIKWNLAFDNIERMPDELNEVYAYLKELNSIATNVKMEKEKDEEGLEW